MTPDIGAFTTYEQFIGNQFVIVGSGERLKIVH